MPSLSIAWNYLTGYSVATNPTTRERAEWPPHPARVFMALAAAWFETEPPNQDTTERDAWQAEGAALRWLETLGDPEMILPAVSTAAERSNVTVYVPVNDRAGPAQATLQSCPAITRSKQPRSFPRVWVGHRPCVFHWPDASGVEIHRDALQRLCFKVTRVGHSSSLVAMSVSDGAQNSAIDGERLVPDKVLAQHRARSMSPGSLDSLAALYGEAARLRHAELEREVTNRKAARKAVSGQGAAARKGALDQELAQLEAERKALAPRPPLRPSSGRWTGYRRANGDAAPAIARGVFDSDILVLTQQAGPTLPLTASLTVARALRDTIMSRGPQPVPSWVSGHHSEGQPLRDADGHLALFPLPVVDHAHADGHLLGLALAFPRAVPVIERGRVLGPLLVEPEGEPKPVKLLMGPLGEWVLYKRDWSEDRKALDPARWSAAPGGACVWATVTPIVLDRFPKANRANPVERPAWEAEVRATLATGCARAGLPEPEEIDVDTTSWVEGSPRAVGKRRPLRGAAPRAGAPVDSALGDGFPPFPPKGTNAPRPQVHAWLRFDRPVVGPVLLGAGRFLGYGLCMPLGDRRP
jgi:CRISPR-associated protein Csb2